MEKKCLRKKDNLWVLFNGKEYCVGLTKEAQEELGAVTFASIQKAGTALKQGETLVELEAEKAVSETLAGLLPATGRAPHVPILHAVHLPALLALSPGLPVRQARKQQSVRMILWAFFADLKVPGKL